MKQDSPKKINPEALSRRGVLWYDCRLTERARELRKNPTHVENILWKSFLSLRPHNYKFLRQKPVGYYILDFFCSELLLCIELDGTIHEKNKIYDAERDNYLKSCGITVIRFKNEEVLESLETVKARLEEIVIQINSGNSFNSD